jgi:hypothetical protein
MRMTKLQNFQILQPLQEHKCHIENLGKKHKTMNRSKYNASLTMRMQNEKNIYTGGTSKLKKDEKYVQTLTI